MQEEHSHNVLLQEDRKLKELQQNFKKAHNTLKNDYKQEEQRSELLQTKITNLQNVICNTVEKFKLEVYNKSAVTNDIFQLRESSDQINDFCCNTRNLLETYNKLTRTKKSDLESFPTKLSEKRIFNEEQLRLQKDEIRSFTENIRNCNILASEEELINNLIEHENKISNNIKSLVGEGVIREIYELEQEIKDIDQRKVKFQTEINQKKELTVLNDLEKTMRKKFEDIQINIVGEHRKAIENQTNANENIFKENVELKYEFKYLQDKLLELQEMVDKESNENLQNLGSLQEDVQVLNDKLHNKENILTKEKEIEKDLENAMEVLDADIDRLKETIKVNNKDLDSINKRKTDLITLNNAKVKTIDLSAKDISIKTDQVQSLKNSILQLEEKNSNCLLTYKNANETLRREMEDNKTNTMIRKRDIDTAVLKHKQLIENINIDALNKFKTEKLKLETNIDLLEGSNAKTKGDIKQFSIKLESNTLECDILLRKIKNASQLQISIREELRPKPVEFERKRQFDETSDSSFDGAIPFYQRMMKKKNKKARTPSLKMTQF